MLCLRRVAKSYLGQQGTPQRVLADASVAVPKGKVAVVVGSNASGKTTLLRIAAGLLKPDRGVACLDSAEVRPHRVGYLPQSYRESLFPWMSVRGNLNLAQHAVGFETILSNHFFLDVFGPLWTKHPSELSGGQCQLVALARALAVGTALILDEPHSGLDISMGFRSSAMLRSIVVDRNVPCLISTHSIDHAMLSADFLYVVRAGQVVRVARVNTPNAERTLEWMKSRPYESLRGTVIEALLGAA